MDERPVIWIIDDDLVSRYATRYRIEQSENGAVVSDFDTAQIALKEFMERVQDGDELPNIIFLDLIMPDMNGWQFLDALEKTFGSLEEPNVYVLSAFSNSKDRNRAKEHPLVQGHFDKPLSKIDMDATLEKYWKSNQ